MAVAFDVAPLPVVSGERPRRLRLLPAERPKTRGECESGPRPCPWVSCRYHLRLDVATTGTLRDQHPNVDHDALDPSCSLDVAATGPKEQSFVARTVGVSIERIRQIEREYEQRIREGDDAGRLHSLLVLMSEEGVEVSRAWPEGDAGPMQWLGDERVSPAEREEAEIDQWAETAAALVRGRVPLRVALVVAGHEPEPEEIAMPETTHVPTTANGAAPPPKAPRRSLAEIRERAVAVVVARGPIGIGEVAETIGEPRPDVEAALRRARQKGLVRVVGAGARAAWVGATVRAARKPKAATPAETYDTERGNPSAQQVTPEASPTATSTPRTVGVDRDLLLELLRTPPAHLANVAAILAAAGGGHLPLVGDT